MRLLRLMRHWFTCSSANVEFLRIVPVAGGRLVETRCRECGLVALSNKLVGG